MRPELELKGYWVKYPSFVVWARQVWEGWEGERSCWDIFNIKVKVISKVILLTADFK
jgi:hypothetical protein